MSRHLRLSRRAGAASPIRPTLRTSYQRTLQSEMLEPRLVLAAITLSANDQLLLELVNRARANPLAEVARYSGISDLNAGLPGGTISSSPKPPLAPHESLITAATNHSLDMLARDYFSHDSPEGTSPSDRAQAAGYPTGVAENIAWGGSSVPVDAVEQVFARHESLFLSPGHRQNMMSESHREAGTVIRYGMFYASGYNWYASMVTEDFGNRGGNPFITGVAFDDTVADDDFYTVGEGAEDVTITAVRSTDQATFSTTTGPSGGYTLQVPNGSYTVTATGGEITTQIVRSNVLVSDANRKVDFVVTEPDPPQPDPDGDPIPDPAETNGVAIVGRNQGNWWQLESTGTSLVGNLWTTWPDDTVWRDVLTGDVDGDGRDDLIGRAADGRWWVTRDTNGGTVHEPWGNWSATVPWYDVQRADVDGDGRDDIIGRVRNRIWWVARSEGDRFVNERWGAWSDRVLWRDVSAGDFDGDGRDDVVGRASNGAWWVAHSTGSEFLNEYWGHWSARLSWNDVLVGDFNGDGRDDLAGRAGETWWVARSTGSAFDSASWGSWSARATWYDVQAADVDGDGRQDIVGRANNGAWWVARSTGVSLRNELWANWDRTRTWSDVGVVDLNLDGREDLVGRSENQWWVAVSTGGDFTTGLWGAWPSLSRWDDVQAGRYHW